VERRKSPTNLGGSFILNYRTHGNQGDLRHVHEKGLGGWQEGGGKSWRARYRTREWLHEGGQELEKEGPKGGPVVEGKGICEDPEGEGALKDDENSTEKVFVELCLICTWLNRGFLSCPAFIKGSGPDREKRENGLRDVLCGNSRSLSKRDREAAECLWEEVERKPTGDE